MFYRKLNIFILQDGQPRDDSTYILAHPYEGKNYEYRDKAAPVLKAFSKQTITLRLPEHMKVNLNLLNFEQDNIEKKLGLMENYSFVCISSK